MGQSRRKAEPKLEVIKMLARDCTANSSKTSGNHSGNEQICSNYLDDYGRRGFEAPHCCSSKLGKFGVIEDGGSHDNCFNLKRRMDLNKSQQTKTDNMDLQNQPNLGVTNDSSKLKDLDSHAGKCNLGNQRALRKKESTSASHVLHYTVCLHGWGNIVLFCDSVAL